MSNQGNTPLKIAILEADEPREALRDSYGLYSDMFINWLSPALPEAQFDSIAAYKMASLPDPTQYDGLLVTGSRHGVYDRLPWMQPMKEILQRARDQGIAVGGICFGHQIMAEAFGAEVRKADTGWVLGRDTYCDLNGHQAKSVFAIHQDQVITAPNGIADVHGNNHVNFGRIEYNFPALSVQYHPEFAKDFFCDLIQYLSGDVLNAQQAKKAIDSTAQGSDSAILATDFAAFYRQHRR